MIMVPKRHIPELKTDEQAAEFWDTHSFTDHAADTEVVEGARFPTRPLKQICLRLAPTQIERVKQIAATRGVAYQTLLRMWITERVREESPSG
jgi:predicted DNA binding CopG/RHH family protein